MYFSGSAVSAFRWGASGKDLNNNTASPIQLGGLSPGRDIWVIIGWWRLYIHLVYEREKYNVSQY
jgi:hypothetical protein